MTQISPANLPYRSRRTLLTPGEQRFYRYGLAPAIGKRYQISMKVRLADVIAADHWRSVHTSRITQKHLDFVLVSPKQTRIVAAIELNDRSHEVESRASRDAFVASAGIPLVTFPIYREYDPKKIRKRIWDVLRR
ncbi:MAG: DUF2726 domain-containing protein [Planctomycetota bacterium]